MTELKLKSEKTLTVVVTKTTAQVVGSDPRTWVSGQTRIKAGTDCPAMLAYRTGKTVFAVVEQPSKQEEDRG